MRVQKQLVADVVILVILRLILKKYWVFMATLGQSEFEEPGQEQFLPWGYQGSCSTRSSQTARLWRVVRQGAVSSEELKDGSMLV